MERQIGEIFEIKLRLKVVEGTCNGCAFFDTYSDVCPYVKELGECDKRVRADKKCIHFEKVSYDVVNINKE